MTIKMFTVAHVPPELAQSWLQHLRDFDIAHPECHFEVLSEGPDESLPEILARMQVEPALKFSSLFSRKSG